MRHRPGAGDEQRPVAARGHGLQRRGQRGHDGRDGDRRDVGEGRVVEVQEALDQQLELVGGAAARRRRAAGRDERAVPERRRS